MRVSTKAIAAAVVTAASAGCVSTPTAPPAVEPVRRSVDACVVPGQPLSLDPPTGRPASTRLRPDPIPLLAGLRTPVDVVSADQVVLDTPLPARARPAGADPADVLVLLSVSAHAGRPDGWELAESVALTVWRRDGGEVTSVWQVCPLPAEEAEGAIRAAGRLPTPAHLRPGESATGWVAFWVPRTTWMLALRLRHHDTTSDTSTVTPLLDSGGLR